MFFMAGIPNPLAADQYRPNRPPLGLLGNGSQSRRWVAGGWTKLHLPLPIAPHRVGITTWTLPPQKKLVPDVKNVGESCFMAKEILGYVLLLVVASPLIRNSSSV